MENTVPLGHEPQDDAVQVITPRNAFADKVRKVSGSINDLLTMDDKALAGKKADAGYVMDSGLEQLRTIFSDTWPHADKRAKAIEDFRKVTTEMSRRAQPIGHQLLAQVADLFLEFLRDVAPERQTAVAIDNYLNALQVIWKQKLRSSGGDIGVQMTADLTKLNRKYCAG
jgi:hypothetical protein